MKRILAYMDFLSPSGFSTVTENIVKRLIPFLEANNLMLDVVSFNLFNKKYVQYHERVAVYNAKEFDKPGSTDLMYISGFLKLLTMKEYEVVWIMNDIEVIYPAVEVINRVQELKSKHGHKPFRTIMYFPIDSYMPEKWFDNLHAFNEIITYTKYGYNIVCKSAPRYKDKLRILPHGIDTDSFYPIDETKSIKEKFNLPDDKIIFGTVNKNQPRKDVANTIVAYKIFKDKMLELGVENKSILYIHSYYFDAAGVDFHKVAQSLGLEFNVDYFLPDDKKEYTTEDLNELYNCFDCFISTSMAEGFGLTVAEAMAVGLPVICGLHTSLKEITHSGYNMLPVGEEDLMMHYQINDLNKLRYKLNPHAIATQMMNFVMLPKHKTLKNPERYKNQIREYNWDQIVYKWMIILKKQLGI